MLLVKTSFVDKVRAATRAVDLFEHLQAAIELEHATIPAYLTALYSIRPGTNREAASIIRSVVVEEMLHMIIAANTLNAIGGAPVIDKPDFIPDYPGRLPMSIGEGLVVGLAKLTKELIQDVFMRIEEPEDPQQFPVKPMLAAVAPAPEYATIGQFYRAIMDKLSELGNSIFIADHSRQVVDSTWFSERDLFPVTDCASAVAALTVIVDQGEGTDKGKGPVDPDGKLAHYYRFAQIYNGRRLVRDAEGKWSYAGAAVPLDPAGVIDLVPNSKSFLYAAGSRARRYADQFDYTYTSLLTALHHTFNGHAEVFNRALGLMYELRLVSSTLTSIPVAGSATFAAPPFEYAAVNV